MLNLKEVQKSDSFLCDLEQYIQFAINVIAQSRSILGQIKITISLRNKDQ